MFWADKVADDIIGSGKYKSYWVDDMKTPSGKIHVGSLRGVVIHDLVYKALKDKDVKVKYTYVFDDHDPMDDLPIYLPEKFKNYLGMPLFKIPSPEAGFDNFAQYYALEFKRVFNAIGCEPEILWSSKDLYMSGKMNDLIKLCLDKAQAIRDIYSELYKKDIAKDWYPFQPYCPTCGKVSTTNVTDWDGEKVSLECLVNKVKFSKGCGFKGKISPFSDKNGISGKLPWKVEWPCKWKAMGITVEGAGKDHMSSGGSHDLAKLICERVINYEVPYPIGYEFFLIGGKKMSSSKGVGSSAQEVFELFKFIPEVLRFLMVKAKINQAINFNPETDTIKLIDDYFKASDAYYNDSDKNLARIFELSQITKPQRAPNVQMSTLTQWVQMPNMKDEIKKLKLDRWAHTARLWIEKYAPEDEKFTIQKELPKGVQSLTKEQKELLERISKELDKKWMGEDLQTKIYEIGKELGLNGNKTFEAIYISLIGKDHGPKAAWLILSLDKEFVEKRFREASSL